MLQSSLRVKQNSNISGSSNETVSPQHGPEMESVSHLEEMVLSRVQDGSLKGDKKTRRSYQCQHQKHVHSDHISNFIESKIDHQKHCSFQEMQSKYVVKLRKSFASRKKTLDTEECLPKMHPGRKHSGSREQKSRNNLQDS